MLCPASAQVLYDEVKASVEQVWWGIILACMGWKQSFLHCKVDFDYKPDAKADSGGVKARKRLLS